MASPTPPPADDVPAPGNVLEYTAEPPGDVPEYTAEPPDVPEYTAEPRTVCFRLFREGVSLFAIEYKDKDDLYRSFMKKLDELNIPRRKMYFVGDYENHFEIDNPDTLLGLTLDNFGVKINVCPEDYNTDSCSDDSELDYETERRREAKSQKCSRHKNFGRFHSRDHSSYPHCSCGCHWYSPGLYHEFSPYSQSYYGQIPNAYYHHPPPFSPFMPFHHRTDPRLRHCPFFGMRFARRGNHPFNGWQDGYYDY
ncbi:unnamed protein product [Angiostrongylus costaricensis]|uniref:Ubiquitin-like domain-containing protein n=1 Tax=Angiostrongylus costaricensis TaxID=334426 RepID=A0A0R3PK01_ANGCS|nr:unnamed protein product [Angiostrongylus costaricensis]